MKYFAALDVSDKETWVCVVDQDGAIKQEGPVLTEPDEIVTFLNATKLKLEQVGSKRAPCRHGCTMSCLALNIPVICLETRHAKAALRAQNMKTDRNDARGLAQIMRTGWYKAVHIKSPTNQKLRMLLKTRRWVVDKRLDLENHIRGTLKVFGFKLGKVTTVTYEPRVRSLITAGFGAPNRLEPLLLVREQFLTQLHALDKAISESREN